MSSSSSQTEGSPNGSPARERSTTRDTSMTLASDGDGQQAEQAPKRTRKSPTKNTSARNGGKKWAIKENVFVWEQRCVLEDKTKETVHEDIGRALGRTAQACRIKLCYMRKMYAAFGLDCALSGAAPHERTWGKTKAEVQEKRPSAKARSRARSRAMKKSSVKVEAQPQKPLPAFSLPNFKFVQTPVASSPSPIVWDLEPIASSPSTVAWEPEPTGPLRSTVAWEWESSASSPSIVAFSPSPVASSPVSDARGSDAGGTPPQWRMANGCRAVEDIVMIDASESSSPEQEPRSEDDAEAEAQKLAAAHALVGLSLGNGQHRPTMSIDWLIGDRDAES